MERIVGRILQFLFGTLVLLVCHASRLPAQKQGSNASDRAKDKVVCDIVEHWAERESNIPYAPK
jgi:hypothetical protein